MEADSLPKHVVILVHGIRDHALWQSSVRKSLEKAGFTVEATNYGRLSLFQFLLPISFFRRQATETVWNQIRIVRHKYPTAKLSVIAHSFGTHVVSNILKEKFEVKFHRVIFCGSVVRYSFPFEHFQERFDDPVLNEVGTADIWPAMAESITWGYGSAGSFGFKRPLVRDRWHEGATHGYFLKEEFCRKYWVPFLKDEKLVSAADDPTPASIFVQLVNIFPIKYIMIAIAALLAIWILIQQGVGDSIPDDIAPEPGRQEPWNPPQPEANFDLNEVIRNSGEARKWIEIAAAEIGQKEVPGTSNNPRIIEYFDSVDTSKIPIADHTAWASIFVNWVMQQAGYIGTRSAISRSWSDWGKAVSKRIGCIGYFEMPTPGAGTGMVGFYLGSEGNSHYILGGNVNNSVRLAKLPDARFVHCRWPTNADIAE